MQVRAARPGDAAAIADVCTRASRQAYAGLVTADYLDRVVAHWYAIERLRAEVTPSPRWFGFSVALVGPSVVGVAGTGRTEDEDTCEVFTLYVDPLHQRHGVGRVLLAHALAQCREAAASRVRVAVMPGNAAAVAFYQACGFRAAGERPIYAPHGADGGPAVALVYARQT